MTVEKLDYLGQNKITLNYCFPVKLLPTRKYNSRNDWQMVPLAKILAEKTNFIEIN